MVASLGGADEDGCALAVHQGGADDLRPDAGRHIGIFVQNAHIQVDPAQGVRVIPRPGQPDTAAIQQINP